jgi:hypothetical protein
MALRLAALLEGHLELTPAPRFELAERFETADEAGDLADLAARRAGGSSSRVVRHTGRRARGRLCRQSTGHAGASLRHLRRVLSVP